MKANSRFSFKNLKWSGEYGYLRLAILGAFGLPLLIYLFLALFTRYIADDYHTAYILQSQGFMAAQRYWYITWSGRYAFTFLISLVGWLGIPGVPLTAVGSILLLGVGIYGLFHELSLRLNLESRRFANLLGTLLVLFIVLRSHGDVHQVFYWQTGMLTYTAPLLLLVFSSVWLLRRSRKTPDQPASLREMLISFLLAFFTAGFSETSLVLEITLVTLLLLGSLLSPFGMARRITLPVSIAALAGALLGMAVLMFAPGNAARQLGFDRTTNLVALAYHSFYNSLAFVWRWIVGRTIFMLITLVLPFLVSLLFNLWPTGNTQLPFTQRKQWAKVLLGIPLLAFLLIWVCYVPAYYALSTLPPGRVLILPLFILVLGTACWGYLAGCVLKTTCPSLEAWLSGSKIRWAILACTGLLLLTGPLYSSLYLAEFIPRSFNYVRMWDQRDQQLRQAASQGIRHVTVNRVRSTYRDLVSLGELRKEPDFWINQDAAHYYGLDSIQVVLPADPGTPQNP